MASTLGTSTLGTSTLGTSTLGNEISPRGIRQGYILEISTIKISIFIKLIEGLKDMLRDITLRCYPPTYNDKGIRTDDTGIIISELNQAGSLFIKIKLPASKFDKYEIKGEPIFITLNMMYFYRLMKIISTDDTKLTFLIEENNTNKLIIEIENKDKNIVTTRKINRLQKSINKFELPNPEFDAKIELPPNDFHKIIKDMCTIGTILDLSYIDDVNNPDTIILKCKGEFAEQETILKSNSSIANPQKVSNLLITGRLELEILSKFHKFSSLCNTMIIYINKKIDCAYIFEYKIANLGDAFFVVSQKINTDKQDCDYLNDDDEHQDDFTV